MDRRTFLQVMAGLAAAGAATKVLLPAHGDEKQLAPRDKLGALLPLRALGQTGANVTMLGVGGWHIGRMSESAAQETIEAALEGGVRFFDTAEEYQNGGSESRLGKLLVPRYREHVFLMTKTTARTAEGARRHLDESLRRLHTDHLDLWQVHALSNPADVDARLAGGVLDAMQEAKAQKKVRHIGFTGHAQPAAHNRMLEKTQIFETCQMPVNALDPSYDSFILKVLPALVERKMGVLAMKTLANGHFFSATREGPNDGAHIVPDRLTLREAIHFVWSLPVSTLITGPDDAAQMRDKIALARSFATMEEAQRQQLIARVADFAGRRVEYYKS